jgi:antitoxin ParD1/3/4
VALAMEVDAVRRDALRFWEKNEELVQHMKLQLLKERLAIGADQAKQGEFLAQSVTEIIAEVRNA